MKPKTDGIWEGDRSAVERAREKYKKDPEGELLSFACALYSFRSIPEYANELVRLGEALVRRAGEVLSKGVCGLEQHEGMNSWELYELLAQIDVLSTYLEWISRDRSRSTSSQLFQLANHLCNKGNEWAGFQVESHHSRSLILLTRARLLLRGRWSLAVADLQEVARIASRIENNNQRARVYRKLGLLFRKSGYGFRGIGWGVRALFVPCPWAVRVKSLAALVGIDR